MAKIGIYIPDERMPDIDRWRDRINFSRLFMEAFDSATAAQAAMEQVGEQEMKQVVERLKRSAERTFESGWKSGAKDGREWATQHSHVSHLRKIGEGAMTFDGPDDDVVGFLRWHYEPQGYVKTPDDEQAEIEHDRWGDSETYRMGFNRGFVDAVKHVWDEVKAAF